MSNQTKEAADIELVEVTKATHVESEERFLDVEYLLEGETFRQAFPIDTSSKEIKATLVQIAETRFADNAIAESTLAAEEDEAKADETIAELEGVKIE